MTGGQSTFSRHLIHAFGPRLAVASVCDDALPEGQWINRPFGGHEIPFFSFGRLPLPQSSRPWVPARVRVYWRAKECMSRLHQSGVRNILLESPEVLLAAAPFSWGSVCYSFAGVGNFVTNSRYPMARVLGSLFEDRMIRALFRIRPDVLIAAADEDAIARMHKRMGGRLSPAAVHSFPTRVDTGTFYPEDKHESRNKAGLSQDATILVTVGRLNWIKGWPLLLEAVRLLTPSIANLMMIFVGDGEDRRAIEARASVLGIRERLLITGFIPQSQVRSYINAADACLVGSHEEGWSNAMLEVLACGKSMVSTSVSGAAMLVKNGKNGWILRTRDPAAYAQAIVDTLRLPSAADVSLAIADRFALTNLARDLGALWKPLAPTATDAHSHRS